MHSQRDLLYRSLDFSVVGRLGAIASTEEAVDMPRYDLGKLVPQVLLMKGCVIPESKKVPLLNSHNWEDINDVMGSATNLRVDGDTLLCDIEVSKAHPDVQVKIDEGHIQSVSVGYNIVKQKHLREGEEWEGHRATTEDGLDVVTEWEIHELSLVAVPADKNAKIFDEAKKSKTKGINKNMNTKELIEAALRSLNDEELREVEEVVEEKVEEALSEDNMEEEEVMEENQDEEEVREDEAVAEDEDEEEEVREDEEEVVMSKSLDEGKKFFREVKVLCSQLGVASQAESLFEKCTNLEEVRNMINESKAKRQKPLRPSVRVTESNGAKLADCFKAVLGARLAPKFTEKESKPKGWEQFRGTSILKMAEALLEAEGHNVRWMNKQDVARLAVQGIRPDGSRHGDPAFHDTGTFANLMLDAVNKTIQNAYMLANTTWETCFRRGEPVQDFKDIHRVKLSEGTYIDQWPEGTNPNEMVLSDAKETYAVEAFSNILSFTYHSLVNDDLGALSRASQILGSQMARTINANVWGVINANAAMADGTALFHTDHANVVSYAAPAVASLSSARAKMRLQTGPSGSILGLEPRYLIVPTTHETVAKQLVGSEYTFESNLFQGLNTFNSLSVVVEPLLDGNDSTAWYLAADPSQIDTVECTFLASTPTPQVRSWIDEANLSLRYGILQAFQSKAIDHRGLVRVGP